jgi:hypothetical protein
VHQPKAEEKTEHWGGSIVVSGQKERERSGRKVMNMKNKHIIVALLAGSVTLATSLKASGAADAVPPQVQLQASQDGQSVLEPGQAGMSVDPEAKSPLPKSADGVLLAKVIRLIEQHARGDIGATVENGLVTLKGTVANFSQKQELESRIKALSGVVGVNDDDLSATNE